MKNGTRIAAPVICSLAISIAVSLISPSRVFAQCNIPADLNLIPYGGLPQGMTPLIDSSQLEGVWKGAFRIARGPMSTGPIFNMSMTLRRVNATSVEGIQEIDDSDGVSPPKVQAKIAVCGQLNAAAKTFYYLQTRILDNNIASPDTLRTCAGPWYLDYRDILSSSIFCNSTSGEIALRKVSEKLPSDTSFDELPADTSPEEKTSEIVGEWDGFRVSQWRYKWTGVRPNYQYGVDDSSPYIGYVTFWVSGTVEARVKCKDKRSAKEWFIDGTVRVEQLPLEFGFNSIPWPWRYKALIFFRSLFSIDTRTLPSTQRG